MDDDQKSLPAMPSELQLAEGPHLTEIEAGEKRPALESSKEVAHLVEGTRAKLLKAGA